MARPDLEPTSEPFNPRLPMLVLIGLSTVAWQVIDRVFQLRLIGLAVWFGIIGAGWILLSLRCVIPTNEALFAFGGLFAAVGAVVFLSSLRQFEAIAALGAAMTLGLWKYRKAGGGKAAVCLLGVFVFTFGAIGAYIVRKL